MFRKTIAVGPFDPVASCVTGGTVANPQYRGAFNLHELAAAERKADVLFPHNRRETIGLKVMVPNT